MVDDGPKPGRLIVLMPACLTANFALARKVHWMASREQCEVLYLTLVDDREDWLLMSRNMATMEAVTSANILTVHSKLTKTDAWLEKLHEVYRPGDTVVCHAEQTVRVGRFQTEPVSAYLSQILTPSLKVLEGFYQPRRVQLADWLAKLLFWLGFFLIVAVFSVLEVQLDQALHGSARMLLLAIVMLFEVGAVWAWNRIERLL